MKITAIISCVAQKKSEAMPAVDLYDSSYYRMMLEAARSVVESDQDIYILSAKHGLIAADEILEPYNTRFGDGDSVTVECIAIDIIENDLQDTDCYVFGSAPYWDAIWRAGKLVDFYPQYAYEGNRGIGDQRGAAATIART